MGGAQIRRVLLSGQSKRTGTCALFQCRKIEIACFVRCRRDFVRPRRLCTEASRFGNLGEDQGFGGTGPTFLTGRAEKSKGGETQTPVAIQSVHTCVLNVGIGQNALRVSVSKNFMRFVHVFFPANFPEMCVSLSTLNENKVLFLCDCLWDKRLSKPKRVK